MKVFHLWLIPRHALLCSFWRFHETLERLVAKLKSIYTASGGKKINIISHSMGGLLVKCFMNLHSDVKFSFPQVSVYPLLLNSYFLWEDIFLDSSSLHNWFLMNSILVEILLAFMMFAADLWEVCQKLDSNCCSFPRCVALFTIKIISQRTGLHTFLYALDLFLYS